MDVCSEHTLLVLHAFSHQVTSKADAAEAAVKLCSGAANGEGKAHSSVEMTFHKGQRTVLIYQ